MNPLQKIEHYKNNFTKSEKQIYNFVKKQPYLVIRHNIQQLSDDVNLSKAAIVRFCKKVGYQGFTEFKFELSRFMFSTNKQENLDSIHYISALYQSHIKEFCNSLSLDRIKELTTTIKKSRFIKIVGKNRSGLSARQLRLRMSKIGYDAESIDDLALMMILQDILKEDDLVILFSVYAHDEDYKNMLKELKNNNIKTALITVTKNNQLNKYCDYTFNLPCISRASSQTFLDDQALFFVFIEILLAELAN